MTTFLLDVSVLIALIDPTHIQHDGPTAILLGPARAHGGRLASFDRRLVVDAVIEGAPELLLID